MSCIKHEAAFGEILVCKYIIHGRRDISVLLLFIFCEIKFIYIILLLKIVT